MRAAFSGMRYTDQGSVAPAVVCVHGLTRAGADFAPLAAALDRRVICVDVMGRGDSEWLQDPTQYRIPRYVEDVRALLDFLHLDTVDFVGTSMGGLIGMWMASEYPHRIRRLVANDVGPELDPRGIRRILDYVGVPFHFSTWEEAERHHRDIYAPFGELSPDQWEALARSVLRPAAEGGFRYAYDPAVVRGTLVSAEELWKHWDSVRCPVLLLRGCDSDVFNMATAEQMLRRNPRARLHELPGRGHAPPLVTPDEIAVVEAFLAE
ncbi:MAG: alpha/beta fold hydrolase [Candidatus Xenobia bacterium]